VHRYHLVPFIVFLGALSASGQNIISVTGPVGGTFDYTGGTPPPTPAPATAMLLGVALLLMFWYVKRYRRQSTSNPLQ
jgi:hypothetical protein